MQGFSSSYSCLRYEITCLSEDQAWACHRGSVAFGSERNSCFAELRRTTRTQDHKPVLSTRQRTDPPGLDSCPRFGHHKLQQRSSLDVPPRRQALKQTNCKTSDRQRGAHCECNRFTDTVAIRSDNKPLFRQIFRLMVAFKCIPWRSSTETNHTTLDFSSCSEAQLLVKAVATHGSLMIGACFQLSSENTTARQLERARQHLTPKGTDITNFRKFWALTFLPA